MARMLQRKAPYTMDNRDKNMQRPGERREALSSLTSTKKPTVADTISPLLIFLGPFCAQTDFHWSVSTHFTVGPFLRL